MNFGRVKAVAQKEFLHIIRDPRSLAMALLLPVLMILLFGYGLSLDVDRIPTVIYDSDNSPESRSIATKFQDNRYFDVVGHAGDYPGLQRSIDSGEAMLGLVIPQHFSQDLRAGKNPQIQLLLDGSDSNTASIALGYANTLLRQHAVTLAATEMNRAAGVQRRPAIETHIRIWYNSDLKSKNFIVPGLIAIVLMTIAALLTSLTIAREWEMGTMEQLISTPLRPSELVLGKMSAFFALGCIDTILAILAGVGVFGVPLRGSLVFLALTSGIFLFGALCWGILISSIARSQLLAYQMGSLTTFLPGFLLSGFIFAIDNMPPAIQTVSYLVPARYFVRILKGIFLKDIGMQALWGEVILLAAFAIIVFFVATRRLNQEVA
ncbi:MAG: ABC transporter permease [Acidobacteriota bacterium]|nr:ABC transporter permease [Acidobacteriota bacterium]